MTSEEVEQAIPNAASLHPARRPNILGQRDQFFERLRSAGFEALKSLDEFSADVTCRP
jgi:hypothetical protein